MPCCAFAAFIISQIVLGFGAVKRLVLRRDDSLTESAKNPATEWRLVGAPALVAPSRRPFGVRAFALVASIEILLAVGALYGYGAHTQHHHHQQGIANVSVRVR